MEIDTLGEAVSTFRRGAKALKAENFELRAEIGRLRGSRSDERAGGTELADVRIPLGVRAAGMARSVVVQCLADHVASEALENARLLVSELVSNSVSHSGASEGVDVIVRVHLWRDVCRLEVEDPGRERVIAPRRADLVAGSGMGLNLVQMLSDRWGVVRAAGGSTRVWAQLARFPALA